MSKRIVAVALSAAVALSVGCASPGAVEGESERLAGARADVRLDPLLSSSRVTLTERDDVIVFGGSVDSLEDMNIIRDIVTELEQEGGAVENAVILLGGEGGEAEPSGS